MDAALDLINRYGLTFLTGYEVGFADDMILAGDFARAIAPWRRSRISS